MIALVVLFLLGLLASALFSGFENGMIQVRQARLDHAVSEGSSSAAKMKFFLDNPAKMLGCILLGNVLANVFTAIFFDELVRALIERAGIDWLADETASEQTLAITSFLVTTSLTLLMLIFGEVTPKVWFRQAPFRRCRIAVWPVFLFFKFSTHVVALLSAITMFIQRKVLRERDGSDLPASQMREDLGHMLQESEEAGLLSPSIRDMMQTALDLPNRTARSIMVPRSAVTCVSARATLASAAEQALQAGCARLPVVTTEGEWIGIFSLYDVLFRVSRERWKEESVTRWMRPLTQVQPNTPLRDILQIANRNRSPLMVVIGYTSEPLGIVTTHDVTSTLFANLEN